MYLRIASVNSKGYTLSDFYIVNSNLSNDKFLLSKINRFQCSINEDNPQMISLRWSTKLQSSSSISNYILYYSDLTNENKNFIRLLTIPINHNELSFYSLNVSLLNLNSNFYHILRFYSTISNQDQYQLPSISSEIYCFFSSKFGKNMSFDIYSIRTNNTINWFFSHKGEQNKKDQFVKVKSIEQWMDILSYLL